MKDEKRDYFDFEKEYILENKFIKLEPLNTTHITELLPIAEESEIWTYSFQKGHDLKSLTNYVNSAIKNREEIKDIHLRFMINRLTKLLDVQGFTKYLFPCRP